MIHWTLKLLVRMLPSGIPICFLMVAACLFYSQNHTTYSRDGDFTLNSDEEMSERYPRHIAGDEKPNPSAEVTPRELVSVSVARKYLLTRRAGLSFWHRGHSASFVAEIPEFSDDSKFLRQLNRQLRDEYERMADEFTTIDWSLVYDGFRDPQFYLRNWEGLIGINIVHSSYQGASVIESHWEYTGGAHGNSFLKGRCFVESCGRVRELKLEDLFESASHWDRQLIAFCLSDLRCQGASSISDVCVEDPESIQFSTDDLASFTLSRAGMTFYFSPYHVGCYAEGTYTVHVPYSVIRDCIPENSPARLFMCEDKR